MRSIVGAFLLPPVSAASEGGESEGGEEEWCWRVVAVAEVAENAFEDAEEAGVVPGVIGIAGDAVDEEP